MSKTVKHCEVCQENFGERFSYCPVCGETLKIVEVGGSQAYSASSNAAAQAPPPFVPQEETVAAVPVTAPLSPKSVPNYVSREPAAANGSASFKTNEPVVSEQNFDTNPENYHDDGLFHLTILQAPKTHRRDFGMGAASGLSFLLVVLTALWVYGLYQFPLDVSPVDVAEDLPYAYLSSADPMEEEEPPVQKEKDKGGGGGGGGKNDPKPVQEGVMPKMTREKQTIAPDVERVVNQKFELKQQATLEGPEINKPSLERYGVVNGGKDTSGGMGEGRGLGSGRGSGIGGGNGTGYGNGTGSGIGNGNGNGIGNGTGSGTGRDDDPPPPKPVVVVSEPLKILSQPRPGYTEEARKNNVQGTVRVRVVFSASGQVTGVSAVSSLPYGLTEKAIAAARLIQFVPMKKNGVPTAVTKTIEYRFTMY